jgi:diguanylate cyclase (GGDEF)-like protein/PAS domain S-box-containing protein
VCPRQADVVVKQRPMTALALLVDPSDAIVAVDVEGRISESNAAAEELFGWSSAEMLDAPMRQLVPADGLTQFDRVWSRLVLREVVPDYRANRLRRDGTLTSVSVHAAAISERDTFAGAVATYRPRESLAETASLVRDRHVTQAPHHGMDCSDRDELTGLLGRRGLQRRLADPVPIGSERAVAMLDVDAFALVNQTYGPDVGDDVLRELASRLKTVADGAVVGRWQADEFLLVLEAEDPAAALGVLTDVALHAVRKPFTVGDRCLYLTVSAGLVTGALSPDGDLFSAATDALRVAKVTGRDRAVWFDSSLRPASDAGLQMANDLHLGIGRGELRLLFQPIIELGNHHSIGVEALVRWERPGVGLLPPAVFLDVAERTGQIVPLDAWVTEHACRTAVRLAELRSGPHSMSINMSARQLGDPGVVNMLRTALEDSRCSPSDIVIEVTETALMQDMATTAATLTAMKELGVSLALDDFGTGYCSLLYLKNFPVDRIKIDQSFISGLGVDSDDTAIVASTIALAHSVGVQAVAEGVEIVDQLTLLRQMGCDFAQGYLFSRPLTLGRLQQWLPEHQPRRRRRRNRAPATTWAPETGRIQLLHREGASLHTIAAALNVDGLRTARGVRWSPQSVARVIARSQLLQSKMPQKHD